MRQARLYKSSRITLLGYLVSQSEYSLLNPYFSTDIPAAAAAYAAVLVVFVGTST
jgi:hypothetical protein